MNNSVIKSSFATLLQNFFCKRLIQQCRVSTCTVNSYKDTFRLLFKFIELKLNKQITKLVLCDLDASLILSFLDYLELERHNNIRSRNARLAAIRSFLKYAALQEPTALPTIQRVLAIPMKRFDHPAIVFLSQEETEAIINAPEPNKWSNLRDRALLATLYNTGARVSEIINIKCNDLENKHCGTVLLHGKGRKERIIPLWKSTAQLLQHWLLQINQQLNYPLFPNRFGKKMTRSGVEKRLRSAVTKALHTPSHS